MENISQTKLINKLADKFVFLYILNCFDILFTYTLLKTGDFFEANFFMRNVVTNPYLSILIKIIFPAILITSVIPYLNDTTSNLKISHIIVNGILVIYLLINSCHIFYTLNIIF